MENAERNFNTLPSGKKLGIYKVANTSLYRVGFTSGGEVPEELKGSWTDAYQAQKSITRYLAKKEQEAAVKELVQEVEADGGYDLPASQAGLTKKKTAKKKTTKKKSVKAKE